MTRAGVAILDQVNLAMEIIPNGPQSKRIFLYFTWERNELYLFLKLVLAYIFCYSQTNLFLINTLILSYMLLSNLDTLTYLGQSVSKPSATTFSHSVLFILKHRNQLEEKHTQKAPPSSIRMVKFSFNV